MTHLWSFLETIPNMKCTYSYSKDFLIYVFERALKGIIKPYPACQAAFHRSLDRVARWGHEVVKFGRGPLNWCDLRWCYCISLQSHDIFLCAYHCITVIWCVSDLCGIWWFVKCVWLYGAHFPTYVQLKHDPSKEPPSATTQSRQARRVEEPPHGKASSKSHVEIQHALDEDGKGRESDFWNA